MGDQALLLVSAYLGQLGLSLWQGKALGEDACRTRKAAQTLAALRNLLLGFLHLCGVPALRSLRRFAVNPMPLYRWLMGCI